MIKEKKSEISNEQKTSETTKTNLDDQIPVSHHILPRFQQSHIEDGHIFPSFKPSHIEDGIHTGEIIAVYGTTWMDDNDTVIHIRADGIGAEIQIRLPTNLSHRSTLGKFIKKSGFEIKEGMTVTFREISKHLIGKKVEFQTCTNHDGWSEIPTTTLKVVYSFLVILW